MEEGKQGGGIVVGRKGGRDLLMYRKSAKRGLYLYKNELVDIFVHTYKYLTPGLDIYLAGKNRLH